jgi:hypothetical protein
MLTIVLPQSFVHSISGCLSENWMNKKELYKEFNPEFVDAFLSQFKEYLTEGLEGEEINYTLGATPEDGYLLTTEILAANQKWLELK